MDASKYVSRVEGHAVVLGGSGGLGAEIARALAASGATAVSVTYGRNKDAAAKVAAEIAGHGVKAFAAHIDQSDEASFNSFLDAAVAATGSGPAAERAASRSGAPSPISTRFRASS